MTNIPDLTAKLKAAALAALPANERLSVLPPDDIFDISLVEGEQLDRDITVMNSFNEIANPANILALTEALENYKAAYEEEARDKEVQRSVIDAALCKLLPGCQYMDPPDGGNVTPLEQVERMVEDYRQRIASLEARTLTVKLPIAATEGGRGYKLKATWAIQEACADAGIKLQIEGE